MKIKWRDHLVQTGGYWSDSVTALTNCGRCDATIVTLADIDDPDKDLLVPEFCEACREEKS